MPTHTGMEDKKAYEAYRLRQFAGPHPAWQVAAAATTPATQSAAPQTHQQAAASASQNSEKRLTSSDGPDDAAADPLGVQLLPDQHRVIVHFDVDAFYSQVEEVRNPALRGRPLAVTQKYLVVTCNYPARQAGVTKLMNIADARKACPGLVLVPGEDLTPYRSASKDIRAVLSRWGPTEKLGLDESWVDITQEVDARMASSSSSSTPSLTAWPCPLATAAVQLTADSKHRPQDLRATAAAAAEAASTPGVTSSGCRDGSSVGAHCAAECATAPSWQSRLYHGCCIAAEMKQAVMRETQYRCSAGVAFNKLLSKLVSGLHKPNGQTAITPPAAAAFIAPLPLRALPGVGYKSDALLRGWGLVSVRDVRRVAIDKLVQALGDKTGSWLFGACRGVDSSPVVASGPPKTISVEDSFKGCSTWSGVTQVLKVLVPDLLERISEDMAEFGSHRRPGTLSIKWRRAGTGWTRSSASTAWPLICNSGRLNTSQGNLHSQPAQHALSPSCQVPPGAAAVEHVELVTAAALRVLKQQLQGSFCLTLLNIGVTGYKEGPTAATAGGIQQYFQTASGPAAAAAAGEKAYSSGSNADHNSAAVADAGESSNKAAQLSRASIAARRDYNSYNGYHMPLPASGRSSPGQAVAAAAPVVLTKRQERQLLEQGVIGNSVHHHQQHKPELLPQQQQHKGSDAAVGSSAPGGNKPEEPQTKRPRIETTTTYTQQKPQQQHYQHQHNQQQQQPPPQHQQQKQQQKHQQQKQQHPDQEHLHQHQQPHATNRATAAVETSCCASQHLEYPGCNADAAAAAAASPTRYNIHSLGDWGMFSCEVIEGYDEDDSELQATECEFQTDYECDHEAHHLKAGCEAAQLDLLHIPGAGSDQQCEQQQQLDSPSAATKAGTDADNAVVFDQGEHNSVELRCSSLDHDDDQDCDQQQQQGCALQQQSGAEQSHQQSSSQQQQQQQQQHNSGQQQQHRQQVGVHASLSSTAPAPAPAGAAVSVGCVSSGGVKRVVIHVDVDCYYCQVEVLDAPHLRGRPLAVTQFNRGGFVAVSYEARAAGVRCGDGVGAAGRAAIPHLREMGAVSEAEARRRCPGLVVLPMRPARYRQVAEQLHKLLRAFAPDGQVEKASYDDFYLDVTAACCGQQQRQSPAVDWSTAGCDTQRVHVVTLNQQQQQPPELLIGDSPQQQQQQQQQLCSNLHALEPELQRGLLIALKLKALVYKTLGLTISCGVAPGRLLARLVGPLNKPNSITALPASISLTWLHTRHLQSIPQLQKATGAAVVEGLGVTTVGQLQGHGLQHLQQRFGEGLGSLLYHVYRDGSGGGGRGSPVRERGPVKQLVCGRSCQPLNSVDELRVALTRLVSELWQRLQHDAAEHSRLPVKLSINWRCGYDKQQSKVAAVPPDVLRQMRQLLLIPGELQAAAAGDSSRVSAAPGLGAGKEGGKMHCMMSNPKELQRQLQQDDSEVTAVVGGGTCNAVLKELVQTYLVVLMAAVDGGGSSSSCSNVKGQRTLTPQRGAKVGKIRGSVRSSAGSPGKRLNVTRVSVGVVFADNS